MFRDAKEELERLEQLLREDETEERVVEEEAPEQEEDREAFDLDEAEEPSVPYRNHANGYGKKIYNSDRADIDLESYSEEVRQPKKRGISCLAALAFALLTGIVIMLGLFLLRMGGYL